MQHPRPPMLVLQDGFVRESNRLREYWFPTRSHSILHAVHCFSFSFLCFFCKVSFFIFSFFFLFAWCKSDVSGRVLYNPLSFCFISFTSFVSARIDSCAMFCRSRSPTHLWRGWMCKGRGLSRGSWKFWKIDPSILRLVSAWIFYPALLLASVFMLFFRKFSQPKSYLSDKLALQMNASISERGDTHVLSLIQATAISSLATEKVPARKLRSQFSGKVIPWPSLPRAYIIGFQIM